MRPRIIPKCVADKYHSPGERIVEFADDHGNGGLISFANDDAGQLLVQIYRAGPKVIVRPAGFDADHNPTDIALSEEM
jgi:hypothetical protein